LALLGEIAGIHRKTDNGYHQMRARRFPHAIFYRINRGIVEVDAILPSRRSPE